MKNTASLHNCIREFAYSSPDKTAIEYNGENYSYLQIEKKSNLIAKMLIQENVNRGNVFVLLDRKPLLVLYLLGILKSGGVFVPLDPRHPESRLGTIMSLIQSNWILTEAQYLDKLNRLGKLKGGKLNVVVDEADICADNYSYLNINILDTVENGTELEQIDIYNENCYIYFTSGSTGTPKGILGRHQSLKHFIDWEISQFRVDSNFRVSQIITPTFDPFLRDIFVPLCAGGTICMPGEHEIILDAPRLIEWIDANRISLMHMVPTLFKNMAREIKNPDCFSNLRYILLAGELLKGRDLEKFYMMCGSRVQLVNIYGPTETTLAKAFYLINEEDVSKVNIPVGRPINDTEILILNEDIQPCSEGVVGEIFISTPYMSSGYVNDNDLNNKLFLENPYGKYPGSKMYKTGDMGRLLPDGNIECLGRMDNQVKIRGMRLELSEIETHILKSGFVKEVVVIAKEDESGDKYLIAFFESDEDCDIPRLRKYIEARLPDYMIPAYFVRLDKMPLLPNGKTDRRTLSTYEADLETGIEYQAPSTEIEEKLVKLWQQVLHAKRIGIDDNFFYLGGHSLKAAKLASKIHKEFNVNLPIKEVFINNTVKTMAQYIESCSKTDYLSIPSAEEKELYPVSSAQKRIFLVNMIENSGISYNMPDVVIVEGELDKEKLEKAFQSIIERHEVLRTSFELVAEGPVQRIHKDIEFYIEYFKDTEGLNMDERDVSKTVQEVLEDFIRPFDLGQAPLFRIRLVKLSCKKYILLRDMHHIISDGISEEILKVELRSLYNGQELTPLKLQYKDFSEWQNRLFNEDAVKSSEGYWLGVFQGELPILNLPTDYQRPPKQSFEGDCITVEVENDLKSKIGKIAESNGATSYMVLLSAFYILLSKYTGQEDIIVGSPVAGRNHADLDNVIGMFINTLALRNYPVGDKTFKEFLWDVRENSIKAFENQNYQFENVIDKLNIKRDLSRNPLFDVMFILQNMDFEEVKLDNAKVMPYRLKRSVSKFDLTLTAVEKASRIELCFEYCTKLFRKETVHRLAGHYLNILRQAVENINIRLSAVDMLSEKERNHILLELNDTSTEYPIDKTIHQLFEAQAENTPDKTALIFEDKTLTYKQLNIKANLLACKLREMNVSADSIVGLMVPRSLEMIIGILGVLKSGGAYLPIDPEFPDERVRYMLENSNCNILLTDSSDDKFDSKAERLNLMDESIYEGDGRNPDSINGPENLIYVIYTSGSTGKPKGVMLEHRNICNFIKGMTDIIDFSADKTILNLTTVSFDIFALETLLPLTRGMTIVIADEKQQLDPNLLSDLITGKGIDILQCTPSRLQLLLKSRKELGALENVKDLIVGGEAFPENLLQTIGKLKDTKIFNVYGPTETAVWSTVKNLTGSRTINIGKPISNTKIYILDKYGHPQPAGIIGELNIAGDGVARGYYGMEDLTREKFVENPFDDGKRMYKTGDLARWLQSGEVEFLGRIDHQVKVRGHRIELSEIEKCLSECTGVKACVCSIGDDEYGIKYLAAYYVSDDEIPVSKIRTHLLRFLPEYMVPQIYVHIEKIPTTFNGKVDRLALPNLDKARPSLSAEFVEAETETQKQIAKIWEEVLGRDTVGVNDSFFDLGGNSLLLVLMYNNLDKLFPGKVTIADIFANPTVARLAQFMNEDGTSRRQVELEFVNLPDEYFVIEDENSEEIVFKYRLEGGTYDRLKRFTVYNNIRISDIMLFVYAYLLAEISDTEKIAIQVAADNENLFQLDVNLSGAADIPSIINETSEARKAGAKAMQYPLSMLNCSGIKKGGNSIAAIFNDKDDVNSYLLNNCDLILKAEESRNGVDIVFECPTFRIRAEKAEEFLNWYIRLVGLVSDKLVH